MDSHYFFIKSGVLNKRAIIDREAEDGQKDMRTLLI